MPFKGRRTKDTQELNRHLREILVYDFKESGMSLNQYSELTGINRNTLHSIKQGASKGGANPSLDLLLPVLQARGLVKIDLEGLKFEVL